MHRARSKNGVQIRLTDERINHIVSNHPELQGLNHWIIETIEKPDLILYGDYSELIALKLYTKSPVSEDKFLAVVYKEKNDVDGFVLTAYFCRKLNKGRKVLWKP